jgi:uncharacterized protein YfaS (alpha-2-macroglobulin family)
MGWHPLPSICLVLLQLKLAAPDITTEQVAAVRGQAAAKVSQLQQLRLEREQAEVQRGEAAARLRAAEAALRDAHQQHLQQRQCALEQQVLQVSAKQHHSCRIQAHTTLEQHQFACCLV